MASETFTDQHLRDLLSGVGISLSEVRDEYGRTFEQLGLDSLARVEIAARIQDRFGLDVEDRVTPELNSDDLLRLVNERLATNDGRKGQ